MDESDLSDLEQTLIDTKTAGHTYLQATFTKFLFKWGMITLLYLFLAPIFPLLKWTLLPLLLIFLYSLYQIYVQKKLLTKKIKEVQLLIKSIKEQEAASKQ